MTDKYGPEHPNWPCPICAGVAEREVSAVLRVEHERHADRAEAADDMTDDGCPCGVAGCCWGHY